MSQPHQSPAPRAPVKRRVPSRGQGTYLTRHRYVTRAADARTEGSPMPSDRSPLTGRRRRARRRSWLEEVPFRTAVTVLAGLLAVLGITVAALILTGPGGAKPRPGPAGPVPLAGPSRAAETASPSARPGTPGPRLRKDSRGRTGVPRGTVRPVSVRSSAASTPSAPATTHPATPPSVALAVPAGLAITGLDVTYTVTIRPAPRAARGALRLPGDAHGGTRQGKRCGDGRARADR